MLIIYKVGIILIINLIYDLHSNRKNHFKIC